VSPAEALRTATAAATESAGEALAARLQAGDVVLIEGDLAAGKTTLVRGMVRGLGGEERAVSSPTFVLVQTYDCNLRGVSALHHVDLYRLGERAADLRELGLEELLSDPGAVVAVEWPKDTLAAWIPRDARTWHVAITTTGAESRLIVIHPPDQPSY
jgi:tRNA threonylcarbamoyl adenosine modification protein YjeE